MPNCKQCNTGFEITDLDREFYKKMDVPEPTLCPLCREQRRIAWRNERNLYKRKCSLCSRDIISVYSPDKQFNVMCPDCWWSDKWNGLEFGRDFDFSRPFFDQFKDLMSVAGLISLFGHNNQNSEFVNQETDDKNCYLNAGGHYNEDCYYNTYSIYGKNNVDCYWVLNSELCYSCVHCDHCYNSIGLKDCINCSNCYFCQECTGCENCFGCYGLKHKKYYFFNEQLSEDEYSKRITEVTGSYQKLKLSEEKAKRHFLKYPHKPVQIINCQNCTGDYLKNSKNCNSCYLAEETEDCKHFYIGGYIKNSMDLSCYGWGEVLYEVASSIKDHNSAFCTSTVNLHDSYYNFGCFNSDNLFGCAGLNHQKYCILNKKYSKEEYEDLVQKIIEHMKSTGEWGEFFPTNISPFGYNETVASEYFPLNKDEVLKQGWDWKEDDPKEFQKQTYEIPDNIKDVKDDILDAVLACEVTGHNYKIIPQELKFYRAQNIPIPRRHHQTRHIDRLKLQNPRKLWDRKCDKCQSDIKTTYTPDRPETVYCEDCYLKTVY